MPKPRDAQRQRVYDGQRELKAKIMAGPTFETLEECAKFVAKVCDYAAIERRYGPQLQRTITVSPKHSGYATGGYHEIRLPTWAWNKLTILHELAHVITQRKYGETVQAHGREYCAIYLDLVRFALGKKEHDELVAGFKRAKVKYRPKRTMTEEARAAASKRLAAARAEAKKEMTAT